MELVSLSWQATGNRSTLTDALSVDARRDAESYRRGLYNTDVGVSALASHDGPQL